MYVNIYPPLPEHFTSRYGYHRNVLRVSHLLLPPTHPPWHIGIIQGNTSVFFTWFSTLVMHLCAGVFTVSHHIVHKDRRVLQKGCNTSWYRYQCMRHVHIIGWSFNIKCCYRWIGVWHEILLLFGWTFVYFYISNLWKSWKKIYIYVIRNKGIEDFYTTTCNHTILYSQCIPNTFIFFFFKCESPLYIMGWWYMVGTTTD